MKRLLIAIAFILLLPLLAATVLLNTTPPLQWAVGKLPEWTDGMVSAGTATGTLAGVIVLHDVRVQAGEDIVSIARIEADAEPSALLFGSIYLPRLRITQVDYLQQAAAEDTSSDDETFDIQSLLSALQLPVTLDFPQVSLNDFNVCRPGDTNDKPRCETWLEEIQFGLLWNDTSIEVSQLDGHSAESNASGNISLALTGGNRINASLAAKSSLRQPALAATLELQGTLSELLLDLQLSEQATSGDREQALLSITGRLLDVTDTARLDARVSLDSMSLATLNDWLALELPADTWSLHGKLSGTLDEAIFEGNINGSYEPLNKIAGDVVLRWHEQRLRIQATELAVLPLSASASTDTTLDFSTGFSWHGHAETGHIGWPGTEALEIRSVTADVRGDAQHLSAHATATVLGKDSEPLELDGELAFDSLQFSTTLNAPRIQPHPSLTLGKVTLQLNGKPEDYRFEGDGSAELLLENRKLPEAQWQINGNGDLQSLSANVKKMNWLGGNLHGRVGVDWQEAVRIEGRLAGQTLDVSPLAELAQPAELNIDSKLSPAFDFRLLPGDSLTAEISKLELGGSYNGQVVKGQGGIAWRKDRIDANDFRIEIGEASLLLNSRNSSGSTPAPGFLHVVMDVPELATLLPGSSGRVTVDAEIDATFRTLAGNGSATASALRWQEWQLEDASLELDLPSLSPASAGTSPNDIKPGNLSARLAGIRHAETRIDSVTLQLQGKRTSHEFELGISAAGNATRLHGSGALDEMNRWQGRLRNWKIENDLGLPEWQLASAGLIRLAADSVDIETHCLESDAARACIGPLRSGGNETHASFDVENLALASFEPLLPGGIRIDGSVDGKMNFHSDASGRRGEADFRFSEGRIAERRFTTTTPLDSIPDSISGSKDEPEEETAEIFASWRSGRFQARLRDRLLTTSTVVDFKEADKATAESRIEFPRNGPPGKASLDGSVDIDISDLSMLPAFFPQLREVHGNLQAGIKASGTLDEPLLTGTLDFTGGSAELTPLGTTWQNIELHLQSNRNRLDGKGSLSSDGGRLDIDISGEARGELLAATLTVRGENFLALRTPEAIVRLSPDLEMQLADRHVKTSGTVRVPYARIRPRDLSSAVQTSPDQVIVNRQASDGSSRFTYEANVTTVLGSDVRFEGFGLDAQLDGRLTVAARSGTPATGSGEVSIRSGKYSIYGQELDIVRGRLIYTGQPLTEPGLDVRALRRIRSDLTVGLNLRGTASQPQLDVFSEPPMSQDETLAYLISGGSIGDATSEERRQVDSASVALGLGAGKLLGQVGERVGVDEIRFSQVGNREEASLILGKYLSPELYVGYGIGLFDAVNSFRVNYQISSKWTLEAISGIKSSADLIYTIER